MFLPTQTWRGSSRADSSLPTPILSPDQVSVPEFAAMDAQSPQPRAPASAFSSGWWDRVKDGTQHHCGDASGPVPDRQVDRAAAETNRERKGSYSTELCCFASPHQPTTNRPTNPTTNSRSRAQSLREAQSERSVTTTPQLQSPHCPLLPIPLMTALFATLAPILSHQFPLTQLSPPFLHHLTRPLIPIELLPPTPV